VQSRQRLGPGAATLLALLAVGKTSQAQELPGKLRVVFRAGTNVFVSASKEKLSGFDVELMERFFAWHKNRTGRELSVQVALARTVDELLRQVQSGSCDLALGSITITGEREKTVDFSTPYLPVRMVLIAPAGRLPQGPYGQILAGRKVGAVEGSTNAAQVLQLQREVSDLTARTVYPGNDQLFAALLSSPPAVDAVVTDITHFWDQKKKAELVLLAPLGPEQGLGIVFPKGSSARPVINTFLGEFLHSASYFGLLRRYFGNDAAEMLRPAGENP